MLSEILLSKIAADAGFELERGSNNGWMEFGIPGSRLVAWIRSGAGALLLALSRADVVRELSVGLDFSDDLPYGAAGARRLTTSNDLLASLARARILDRTLPDALLTRYQREVAGLQATEVLALVAQRRGQDIFRDGLLEYWQARCAITRLAVPALLRASHAKPWKDASDAERLDVHNGLLLTAHLDAAFDQGLITVAEGGEVRISDSLDGAARAVLGLDRPLQIYGLCPAHMPYLHWHRTKVFRANETPPA